MNSRPIIDKNIKFNPKNVYIFWKYIVWWVFLVIQTLKFVNLSMSYTKVKKRKFSLML